MNPAHGLDRIHEIVRKLSYLERDRDVQFLRDDFAEILAVHSDDLLPGHSLWPILIHMLICCGEHHMAMRAMRMLIAQGVLCGNMRNALDLLERGEVIAAAYVARGIDSYNTEIVAYDAHLLPPAVVDAVQVLPTDAKILDLGCGTGLTGQVLRRAGFQGQMVGIDMVAEMIAGVPSGLYTHLAVSDACRWLSEQPTVWDGIISFGVFVHLPESVASQTIALAAQRLRLDGFLAFNAPEKAAPILHALPLAKATGLIDQAGLDLEAVKRDEERTTYLCRKVAETSA